MSADVSVVLPCLNESGSLPGVVARLRQTLPEAEIVVVDDGSDPPIGSMQGAKVIRHPRNLGNGAAIKTGARRAAGDILVFMDADGQHDPEDIPRLLAEIDRGFDLVVGARTPGTQASRARAVANRVFNRFASLMTGCRIDDLTSGFRAARARPFRNFLYLLPNGFSYPTTSTMSFFRCGYAVTYVPIEARRRRGKSKIRWFHDGIRFLVIILRVGALFSPMRVFLPLSLTIFALASGWYAYAYFSMHRFTNMSAALYLSSLFTLMFGVISEQISALHYRYSEERRRASDYRVATPGEQSVESPSGTIDE